MALAAPPHSGEGVAPELDVSLSVTRAVEVCGWLIAATSLVVGAGLLHQLARSR